MDPRNPAPSIFIRHPQVWSKKNWAALTMETVCQPPYDPTHPPTYRPNTGFFNGMLSIALFIDSIVLSGPLSLAFTVWPFGFAMRLLACVPLVLASPPPPCRLPCHNTTCLSFQNVSCSVVESELGCECAPCCETCGAVFKELRYNNLLPMRIIGSSSKERCRFRHASQDDAERACGRLAECGGFTMDGGLLCGDDCSRHRYELRSHSFEMSASKPAGKTVRKELTSWRLLRRRTKACLSPRSRSSPAAQRGLITAASSSAAAAQRGSSSSSSSTAATTTTSSSSLAAAAAAAAQHVHAPSALPGSAAVRSLAATSGAALVRFIVLVEGHSGSSWLCEFISFHSCGFCNQENSCVTATAAQPPCTNVQESCSCDALLEM